MNNIDNNFRKGIERTCLGTMYFGTRVDKDTSFKLLDKYIERGGKFLDTANVYAFWVPGFKGGESEKLLGEWIRRRKNKHDLFIATKVGVGTNGAPWGLKRDTILKDCDKSLKRLGVDTIDLYYAHIDDRDTSLEETMDVFNTLIKEGKVRYIGASNYSSWRLEEAACVCRTNNLTTFCCIQNHYSYLRPRTGTKSHRVAIASDINEEMIDYCRTKNMVMLSYSPLLQGAYIKKDRDFSYIYKDEDNNERLKRINRVAEDVGATVNQVVLAWMLEQDPPVIPLITASRLEHLEENLDALKIGLTKEHFDYLDIHNEYRKGNVG